MQDRKNNSAGGTFECYSKKVCRGNFPYPHDDEIRIRIGGVDYKEDGRLVCLNCRLRNDSFRQPEDDYWCGPYKNRTFVADIAALFVGSSLYTFLRAESERDGAELLCL